MGKILSIDYGRARVGLAITDSLKITAQGLDSLEIAGEYNILLNKIKELIEKEKIEEIVIGDPKHMNGDKSNLAEEIDYVIEKIKELNIPVIKWDERLTTVNAYKDMRSLGIKQTEKKKYADRLAATYILEDYLSSKK
jgi:putative Holliday junction resolvase